MNLNLESISNPVVAMPARASVVPTTSSTRGSGGFESALTAAQALSATPETAAVIAPASGSAAESPEAANQLNGRLAASGNPPAKKTPTNSSALGVCAAGAANPVPQNSAPAVPVQPPLSQTNSLMTSALTALPQTSSFSTANAFAVLQADSNVAPQSAGGAHPFSSSSTAVISSPASLSASLMNQPTPAASNQNGATTSAQSITGFATPDPFPSTVPANITGSVNGQQDSNIGAQTGAVAASTLSAATFSSTTFTPDPTTTAAHWGSAISDQQQNVPDSGGEEPGAANSRDATFSAANLRVAQADASSAVESHSVLPADPSVQAESVNPLPAMPNNNGQVNANPISAAIDLNALAPAEAAKTSSRFYSSKNQSSIASPQTRGSSSTPASESTSASTASDLGTIQPPSNQTPFSVFFSAPGPGTEAAASTLPKLILPVTSSAIRDTHSVGSDPTGAISQTTPSPAGNNATHNVPPQTTRGASIATESGSPQAGAPSRHDPDTSAAAVQAAAQNVSAPTSAPPVATTLPLSTPPVPDALPKANTLPGPDPATAFPTSPEILPKAIAGPVQMAQLINRVDLSEMRIGMNTAAFGSVEVHTIIHANDVGLVIGSEKGDLRTLLQNDLPAIANTLQEQNLRLHTVNFMQGFAFSNNASGGGDSQPRPFTSARASSSSALPEVPTNDFTEPPPAENFDGGSLSILA